MHGLPLSQNVLETLHFRLFVPGPVGRNPNAAGAIPVPAYLHPTVARAISQPLRGQECTVTSLMWYQIYVWLLRQLILLVTPVSPPKYKPHRPALRSHSLSQWCLCSASHLPCSSCLSLPILYTVSMGTLMPSSTVSNPAHTPLPSSSVNWNPALHWSSTS